MVSAGSSPLRIAPARVEDRAALDTYLAARTDTCMFMRGNLNEVGLAWSGQRYGAQYALAWRGDAIVGAVGHAWNDMLLVQADEAVSELASAAVALSRRTVAGFSGPLEQVVMARSALGMAGSPAKKDGAEVLMSVALVDLRVPPALLADLVRARRATSSDRARLVSWRTAYLRELVGKTPGPELDAEASSGIDAGLAQERAWVLEAEGEVVSMTMFNAVLPDCVQVGGVYTPPLLRGRGYARSVVAASLLDARDRQGARRAVLFTPRPDAEAAYRAIGFAPIGRFGLVVFR